MRPFTWLPPAALALALASAGCVTLDEGPKRATQEREDVLRLEEKINRLNGRLEAIEIEHRQVLLQLDQVRRASATASADQNAALKTRLDDLDRRIQALDAAREADKQQIAEAITKKLLPYLSQPSATPSRATAPKPSGGTGGEHEVQSGETLSKIAATYGITVSELMAANGIENANMVRQGQKLVIPKR
jgi:LysM repeat protein